MLIWTMACFVSPVAHASSEGLKPKAESGSVSLADQVPVGDEYLVQVDPGAHRKFGLYYPVTYKFRIPAGSSGLTAQYRYDQGAWQTLTEKKRGDVYNGIDAARYDYQNGFAYLSVRFSRTSDRLYLRVVTATGDAVSLAFDSIPKYYDDRKGAVSITVDDWNLAFDAAFRTATDYLAAKGLPFTVAIIAADVNWASVQEKVNRHGDLMELASHSMHHACSAADYQPNGYQTETSGSRDAIAGNVIYQDTPFVPVYVEPCGYSDANLQTAVSAANYLVERSSNDFFGTASRFIDWDPAMGRYGRAGVTYNDEPPGDTPALLAQANALFDQAMAAGGIYTLEDHPYNGYWHDNSFLLQHLDHIKGRSDVWYVPFGELYQYHFLQEMRGNLTIQHLLPSQPVVSFSATPRSGRSPLTVSFTDTSLGSISSWLWDFGDGTTAAEQNPTHPYVAGGGYPVKLTVSGPQGSGSRSERGYITVNSPSVAGVSITSPGDGASFNWPTSIPITVSANASSWGTVKEVQYFSGDRLLGANGVSPYGLVWPDVPLGSYQLRAVVVDSFGEMAGSQVVRVKVTPSVPAAPAIVSVSAVNGTASVALSAPSFDGGSAITSYVVTASPGGSSATGSGSPITVSSLGNGTPYTFTARARNAAGTGPASAPSAEAIPLPNGDLNGDGAVDLADAMLALRISLGMKPATVEHQRRGDVAPLVNGVPKPDGSIGLGDVVVLLRKVVGLASW